MDTIYTSTIAHGVLFGLLKSNAIDTRPLQKRMQYIELCKCSMLHGGDSDSTVIVAFSNLLRGHGRVSMECQITTIKLLNIVHDELIYLGN